MAVKSSFSNTLETYKTKIPAGFRGRKYTRAAPSPPPAGSLKICGSPRPRRRMNCCPSKGVKASFVLYRTVPT